MDTEELKEAVIGKKKSECSDVDMGEHFKIVEFEDRKNPDAEIIDVIYCGDTDVAWTHDGNIGWYLDECDSCGGILHNEKAKASYDEINENDLCKCASDCDDNDEGVSYSSESELNQLYRVNGGQDLFVYSQGRRYWVLNDGLHLQSVVRYDDGTKQTYFDGTPISIDGIPISKVALGSRDRDYTTTQTIAQMIEELQ